MQSDVIKTKLVARPALLAGAAFTVLSACNEPLDFDLRGKIGGKYDTSQAALNATANRPKPDDRGIISYPNYQVAVARRGDTLTTLAERIGVPVADLARYNGIKANDTLRRGEVIALPKRVAEPSPATGAATTGPIKPAAELDITELAGSAIESSEDTPAVITPAIADVQTGNEPVRHKVERGETAFTIARLYGVSVRSLADWNGLDREYRLREGQFLLIPVAEETAPVQTSASNTSAPGTGSPTPTPPSAKKPLPAETTVAAATPAPAVESPKLGNSQTKTTSSAKMSFPVNGAIIREYSKGKNDGIDISASTGTAVKAATSGQVAAITSDADKVPIVVIKHPNNLLTVYANLDAISVKKGDNVSRGQSIGKVRAGSPSYVHFEVREGFESVDPLPYLK